MNPELFLKQYEQTLKEAEQDILESNRFMASFVKEWQTGEKHPPEDLEALQSLKLLLQYRLDTQNILSQLAQLQNYLLQILGVERLHSFEQNIERLAFALGIDDLQHLLTLLNHLVSSLEKILAQTQQQRAINEKKHREHLRNNKEIPLLGKSLEKLHAFGAKVKHLELVLENIAGAPQPGIIYDHIAAMEGPISRFQQALNHGLGLSYKTHSQMEYINQAALRLSNTIPNTHQYINTLQNALESHRLFTPAKDNTPVERLEERAMTKRLGNFFNR